MTSRSCCVSELDEALAGSSVPLLAAARRCWDGRASRPIEVPSRDELFEIPKGTYARRMAGDKVEILPSKIRLTLGLNDVLLLRNLDDVPQVFGPTIMMPGQSFRLPFEKAASYDFACTAHASGQMTIAGGAVPGDAVVEDPLARARVVGEQNKMKGFKQALPSIVVIAVVVAIWWAVVVATKSAIFPDALGGGRRHAGAGARRHACGNTSARR